MKALERARELMETPRGKLPPIARKYAEELTSLMALCMEVILTAFAHYAQVVEGLPCDDPMYQPSEADRAWFKENMP